MNKMKMMKKNYTTPVTEFVALKPIYELLNANLGMGSDTDRVDPDDGIFVNKDEHGGSWENIWGAE